MYTNIPNSFIDEHAKTNPAYIVAYIALKRLCLNGECDVRSVADYLGYLESDVSRILSYWENENVVKVYRNDAEPNRIKVDFVEDSGLSALSAGASKTAAVSRAVDNFSPDAAVAQSKPVYSPKELDYYTDNDEDVRNLFKFCEKKWGKLLSYNDMSDVFALHDWLRMPIPLIELLVDYCAGNGKNSVRYVFKVAVDWVDAGIDSLEKAKARIKLYNKDFRAVLAVFGQSHREPTKNEEAAMTRWFKTYGLPLDVIIVACERTVMQTGRFKLEYAEKILESWFAKNIKTIADIAKADADFCNQINTAKVSKVQNKAAAQKSLKTKFSNFEEREIDYEEIEKIEMEWIDWKLKQKNRSNVD